MHDFNSVKLDDPDNLDEIYQLFKILDPKNAQNVSIDVIKKDLEKELEEKRKEVFLNPADIGSYLIHNFVKKDNVMYIDYSWTPTQFFEDLFPLIHHNFKIISEDPEGNGEWNFTFSVDVKGIDFYASCPEDIIDNLINPLLNKKTDMEIVYPKGDKYNREVHIFILVKKTEAEILKCHPMFVSS